LQPLLLLHAFRHLGLVFLVPTVVGPALPSRFAVPPAAYGDLVAGILALAAMAALRARPSIAVPLTWIFNVFGFLDLVRRLVAGWSIPDESCVYRALETGEVETAEESWVVCELPSCRVEAMSMPAGDDAEASLRAVALLTI
jgi:hypothetical protein